MGSLLASALLACTLASAQAAQPDPGQAQQLVKGVTDQMLDVLRQEGTEGKADLNRIRDKVNDIVLPHMDFITMTKLAVGSPWRNASDDQKRTLVTQFRELLVRTYTRSLDEYDNQKLEFLPMRPSPYPDRVTVRSRVLQSNGPEIPVEYSLRFHDGEWKVYDIVVDGVSLVTTYRSSFASQVQQNGIDGLIDSLRKKNAANESGTGNS